MQGEDEAEAFWAGEGELAGHGLKGLFGS